MGYRTQHDRIFTYEKQSTWGTRIDTAPTHLAVAEWSLTNTEPTVHIFNIADGTKAVNDKYMFSETSSKAGEVAFNNIILDSTQMLDILKGIFPFTGSWTSASGVWNFETYNGQAQPEPKNDNNGYFYTVTGRVTSEGNQNEYLKDVMWKSLELSVDKEDNDSTLVGNLAGIGSVFYSSASCIGTVTYPALTYKFKSENLKRLRIGSYELDTNYRNFNLKFDNGLALAIGRQDGERSFGRYNVVGSLKLGFDDNTPALKALTNTFDANSALILDVRFGHSASMTALGDLALMTPIHLTKFTDEYAEEGSSVTFEFVGCASGSNPIFSASTWGT